MSKLGRNPFGGILASPALRVVRDEDLVIKKTPRTHPRKKKAARKASTWVSEPNFYGDILATIFAETYVWGLKTMLLTLEIFSGSEKKPRAPKSAGR